MVTQVVALLTRYGFEMRGYTAQELMDKWLKTYQVRWVRLAVVEALYQGRYKAVSVEHILRLWFRRGNPTFHFTHEFEHLICRNLPRYFPTPWDVATHRLDEDGAFMAANQETLEIPFAYHQASTDREMTWDVLTVAQATTVSQQPSQTIPNSHHSTVEEALTHESPLSSYIADETNLHRSASQGSIHQFTPLLDESELYVKLKAVAQQGLDKNYKL
ncbi:MAG: hypothetical protein ACRDEA_14245 [Microcystaceae cyanobacterium]